MKYALAKFRVYLLGDRPFVVYTDHASLRTAVHSPHLSPRMARWLSFFAEYNFRVEYKPGRQNVVADALSRRPDYLESGGAEMSAATASHSSVPTSPLLDDVRKASARDQEISRVMQYLSAPSDTVLQRISPQYRSALHRYSTDAGLLWYRSLDDDAYAVVVPDDYDLRLRIIFEYHDAPPGGHRGSEKTYLSLRRDFYWSHQLKWVRKYVRTCEVCQRVKPSQGLYAPLHSLPVPAECWQSVSMDFVFGLPQDPQGRDGILVFVDRFSKMVHLVAVAETISAAGSAKVFVESVFRLHGLPRDIVSDRDPRFTAAFWQAVFRLLGTRLRMSTADHPQTDGQTERANRVLVEILRAYAHSFEHWSDQLAMVEFAINNSVHASTGYTPFFVNGLRHPLTPALLGPAPLGVAFESAVPPALSGGGTRSLGPQTLSSSMDGELHPVTVNDALAPSTDLFTDGNGPPFQHSDDTGSPERIAMDSDDMMSPERTYMDDEESPTGTDMDVSAADTSVALDTDASPAGVAIPTPAPDRRARHMLAQVHQFMGSREAINRFVQDAIAEASDRQKKQADKNGRTNVFQFNVGDLVLLSTQNLPEHAVTAVGCGKLLPRYIGPFRVLTRRGLAYTLDLPSVMRTHPTFYVGRLKPYRPHSRSEDASTSSPSSESARVYLPNPTGRNPNAAVPRHGAADSLESASRGPADSRTVDGRPPLEGRPPRGGYDADDARHRLSSGEHSEARSPLPHTWPGGQSTVPAVGPSPGTHESPEIYPPPPAPVRDAQGQQYWHVDALIDHRDRTSGRATQRRYRVRWRGYPPEYDTWEPRESLILDVPEDVQAYDRTHPLPPDPKRRRRRRRVLAFVARAEQRHPAADE